MRGAEGEEAEGAGVRGGEGDEAGVCGGGGGSEEGVEACEKGEGHVVVDYDDWVGFGWSVARSRSYWGKDVLVPTLREGFKAPAALVTKYRGIVQLEWFCKNRSRRGVLMTFLTPRAAMNRIGYATVASPWPSYGWN